MAEIETPPENDNQKVTFRVLVYWVLALIASLAIFS